MSYLELLKLASPELLLVFTALLVLTVALTRPRAGLLYLNVAVIGLVLTAVAVALLPRHAVLSGGMLVISPLISLFQVICLLLALFAVLLAYAQSAFGHRAEYIAIILFATVGLLVLVSSEELLTIFVGLELLGLSLYVITAIDKADLYSSEAALKYFLFGSTTSAFTLFGISLVYGVTQSTSLTEVGHNLLASAAQPLLAAALVMTMIGFLFKIAAVPFHFWAPDTYQAAPGASAAFIASASKVASFFVLGKILLVGFAPLHGQAGWQDLIAGWSPLLSIIAAISIVVGNFVALAQRNVGRLLAYSAVAHGGYALLGIIAGADAFSATLFYVTIYSITLVGAFAVCAVVREQTGGTDLENFAGLYSRSPVAAGSMAVFLLSLAGLPPLAGFFGKFYLFSVALGAGENQGLFWLVIIALFGSFVSLYYYLVVLKAVFVESAATPVLATHSLPRIADHLRAATILICAFGVVFFGIAPAPLLNRIAEALA